MKKISKTLIIVLLMIVGKNLNGQTHVSGLIVGQTWTLSGSPYIVDSNIYVASLTIDPAVTVIFDGNYKFEVAGVLIANGTICNRIKFIKSNAIVGWQGIKFNVSSPGSILNYCIIRHSVNSGISIVNSTPTITNCEISYNTSTTYGAGIFINQTTGLVSTVENSRICYNTTNHLNNLGDFQGGGIYGDGDLLLKNCNIENNTCFARCYASWCTAVGKGGGIYWNGNLTIENCKLLNNRLSVISYQNTNPAQTTSLCYGGGVFLNNGNFNCSNSIIGLNTTYATCHDVNWSCVADKKGSGVYINNGTATIINSTIAYNSNTGIFKNGGVLNVLNSILYFNNSNGSQLNAANSFNYSDVQGGFAGMGNIDFNPIFQSTTDFTIVQGSTCMDAGDTNSIYNDLCFPPSLGLSRNDMGAHGGPLACDWNGSNSLLFFIADTITNTSGWGMNDGSINIYPSGGIPPYFFSWTGPNGFASSTQNINSLYSGWYVLTHGDSSCSFVDSFYVSDPVGLSVLQEAEMSISPNPATFSFTISTTSKLPKLQVELINFLGQKIYSTKIIGQQQTINCEQFAKGIYFVKVSDGEKHYTQKLVLH